MGTEHIALAGQAVPFVAEPMTFADIDEVTKLARVCFASPWSARTLQRDLEHNPRSRYWVVRASGTNSARIDGTTADYSGGLPPIIAYGGCWLLGEEIHIITLATHPAWRRRRLAMWLLLVMLADARKSGGSLATLEVRESNCAAYRLYTRLGFCHVGRRIAYYTVNAQSGLREDALLLTLDGLDEGAVWRPLRQRMEKLGQETAGA